MTVPERIVAACSERVLLSPAAEVRFWAQVRPGEPDECWPWTGKRSNGYGYFWYERRQLKAARVLYEHVVARIPDGLVLDHLCRNRACVNPAHLEPVTNRENILRGESPWAKLANRTHCDRGHELTEENRYARPDGKGWNCSQCCRERERERRRHPEWKKAETDRRRRRYQEDAEFRARSQARARAAYAARKGSA